MNEELAARLVELTMDTAKLQSAAQAALSHAARGDLNEASLVIGLAHYPLGDIQNAIDGLLKLLASLGASPDSLTAAGCQ